MRHDTALSDNAGGQSAGSGVPVATEQPHARRIAAQQHSEPIVLDFVQPARPSRRFGAGLGRQGSQKSGKATRRNNMAENSGIPARLLNFACSDFGDHDGRADEIGGRFSPLARSGIIELPI
jgi:hypothetical protein